MGNQRTVLSTRVWDKGFVYLRLGESLTLAEDAFRAVVKEGLCQDVRWKNRDIILSDKKRKRGREYFDPDGRVLRGNLASAVLDKKGWGPCASNSVLSEEMQRRLLDLCDAQREAERQEDFRTIFFRAVGLSQSGEEVHFRSVVRVWTDYLGYWSGADVKVWVSRRQPISGAYRFIPQEGVSLVSSSISLPPVFLRH